MYYFLICDIQLKSSRYYYWNLFIKFIKVLFIYLFFLIIKITYIYSSKMIIVDYTFKNYLTTFIYFQLHIYLHFSLF